MKKSFCFTVDDNIRFLREICEGGYESIFAHPYLALYKRLHEKYGVSVQLNLFFENGSFSLSDMSECYREEWRACSDWLKLSFHSRSETVRPYADAGYDEVFGDCERVKSEILRFASRESLAATTTVHYCEATAEGIRALSDCGVIGLLGLYGSEGEPCFSYQSGDGEARRLRAGETVLSGGIYYGGIDLVLNKYEKDEMLRLLRALLGRPFIKVMIHEQYFYSDYPRYQSDFEDKLDAAFALLTECGYRSIFFEEAVAEKMKLNKTRGNMNFFAKTFDELSPRELYEILKSRQEIFLLEQNIICNDLDGLDTAALHCFIYDGERVLACLRAIYLDADTVKIGRVITLTHGAGLGRRLMESSLEAIKERMPAKRVTVSSQTQASGYYATFGFRVVPGEYDEDGVPHVKMERAL